MTEQPPSNNPWKMEKVTTRSEPPNGYKLDEQVYISDEEPDPEDVSNTVSRMMKEDIQKILALYDDGISCIDFPTKYKKSTGRCLSLRDFGFNSVMELMQSIPDIVYIHRESPNSIFMLYDASNKEKVIEKYARKPRRQLFNSEQYLKIPDDFKRKLIRILEQFHNGVDLLNLPLQWKSFYGDDISNNHYNYPNLEHLLLSLVDDVVSFEYGPTGDQIVRLLPDANRRYLPAVPNVPSSMPVPLVKPKCKVPPGFADKAQDMLCQFNVPEDAVVPGFSLAAVSIPEDWSKNVYKPVRTSEIIDPSNFYIQLGSNDPLDLLMNELEQFYFSPQSDHYHIPEQFFVIGLVCAAMYEEEWHRAKVIAIMNRGRITVSYVDYGTTFTIEQSCTRLLKKQFADLPSQAVRAKLANIIPKQNRNPNGNPLGNMRKRWSTKAKKLFFDLCRERDLLGLLIGRTVDIMTKETVLRLCLVDTSDDDEIHIQDKLVDDGFAVFCDEESANGAVTSESNSPSNAVCSPSSNIAQYSNTPSLSRMSTLASPQLQSPSATSTIGVPPAPSTAHLAARVPAAVPPLCMSPRTESNNGRSTLSTTMTATPLSAVQTPMVMSSATSVANTTAAAAVADIGNPFSLMMNSSNFMNNPNVNAQSQTLYDQLMLQPALLNPALMTACAQYIQQSMFGGVGSMFNPYGGIPGFSPYAGYQSVPGFPVTTDPTSTMPSATLTSVPPSPAASVISPSPSPNNFSMPSCDSDNGTLQLKNVDTHNVEPWSLLNNNINNESRVDATGQVKAESYVTDLTLVDNYSKSHGDGADGDGVNNARGESRCDYGDGLLKVGSPLDFDDNQFADDAVIEDDGSIEQMCRELDSMSGKKRYVKLCQLTNVHQIHLVLYKHELNMVRSQVSSFFWKCDLLQSMLATKKLRVNSFLVTSTDEPELLSELIRYELCSGGSSQTTSSDTSDDDGDNVGKEKRVTIRTATLYPLDSVLKILDKFKPGWVELREALVNQLNQFNPEDSYWGSSANDSGVNISASDFNHDFTLQVLKNRRDEIYMRLRNGNTDQSMREELAQLENRIRTFELESTEIYRM